MRDYYTNWDSGRWNRMPSEFRRTPEPCTESTAAVTFPKLASRARSLP
jgi:hypothetical protein